MRITNTLNINKLLTPNFKLNLNWYLLESDAHNLEIAYKTPYDHIGIVFEFINVFKYIFNEEPVTDKTPLKKKAYTSKVIKKPDFKILPKESGFLSVVIVSSFELISAFFSMNLDGSLNKNVKAIAMPTIPKETQ